MVTKIDFYYWGSQCPWIGTTMNLLAGLKKNMFSVQYFDVSENHHLAEEMNMFSSILLVFNDNYRWNGPITRSQIMDIARGKYPVKKPYKVNLSKVVATGELKELTEETVMDSAVACDISLNHQECCLAKQKWVKRIREKYDLPHLGLLHYVENQCVGGAEFVPSLEVPYPVPKAPETAFLTCSFRSDELFDYRSFPLARLEEQLRKFGFRELIAVVSEQVLLPNGPLAWFLERKYKDLGSIYYEKNDHAKMHLVSKMLQD